MLFSKATCHAPCHDIKVPFNVKNISFNYLFLNQQKMLFIQLFDRLLFRDENMVTEAIELNEELHKVLLRHDSLLSVGPTCTATSFINNSVDNKNNQHEEEDAESLYKRYICFQYSIFFWFFKHTWICTKLQLIF